MSADPDDTLPPEAASTIPSPPPSIEFYDSVVQDLPRPSRPAWFFSDPDWSGFASDDLDDDDS